MQTLVNVIGPVTELFIHFNDFFSASKLSNNYKRPLWFMC